MTLKRFTAAAAALVVTGAAFAAPSADNGAAPTITLQPASFASDMTYTLVVPNFDEELNTGMPSRDTNSMLNLGAGFGAGQHLPTDNGTIWLGSDLSYELPGSGTTVELGLGWYGIGGGLDFYPNGGHNGFMLSLRAGWVGSGGVAVNGAANYVGHFSPNLVWRLGIGVEYQSNSGWLNGWSNVFPIGIADIGFRL